MTKNRSNIGIAVDTDIKEKLERESFNKSKLINSLLGKWLRSERKNIKNFIKNNH